MASGYLGESFSGSTMTATAERRQTPAKGSGYGKTWLPAAAPRCHTFDIKGSVLRVVRRMRHPIGSMRQRCVVAPSDSRWFLRLPANVDG